MNRISITLSVLVAMITIDGIATETNREDRYSNYYAAKRALERGDCHAVVFQLEAYLRNHSYIQEEYPDHYREIRFAMDQCKGGLKIRGIEDESGESDLLPDHPPIAD
ncbi:MAG: hypothetical protein L0Y39_07315 [Methylococcaceae bacterium]|nr:hypothetical protein [Methylococcaceae bacterium]